MTQLVIPIESLIAVGRLVINGDDVPDALFEALINHDQINRMHWSQWDPVTTQLSNSDLVALFRGLIRTERQLSWGGGSVAAGVWVFRELCKRSDDLANAEADWSLSNSDNPWIPFGANRLGASSLADYRERRKIRDRCIQVGLAAAQEAEFQAARDRELSQRQRARADQMRRSEIRKDFIAALSNLTIEQQLRQLAGDAEHPIEWYPTRLAGAATAEMLSNLEVDIREQLLQKCAGNHRGAWSRFKRRLVVTGVDAPRGNRRPWFP